MSDTDKQHFLNLMRMERVLPVHLQRSWLSGAEPKELLARCSYSEFTRLVEDIRADHVSSSRGADACT
jgi:hypothetical protein